MTKPKDQKDDAAGITWRSARVAQALSACLHLTAIFAAPRALERWRASRSTRQPQQNKEGMVKQLEDLDELFRAEPEVLGQGAMQEAPKLFAELRPLVAAWDDHGAPSEELVAKARATLGALGLPEPPGGWDSYEPPDSSR